MNVLIKCPVCEKEFWVKGDSPGPNSYSMADDADLGECCSHIQADGGAAAIPIDADWPEIEF